MPASSGVSKAVQRTIERTDKAIVKGVTILLKEIEKEARAAIKCSPTTLKAFSMVGGRTSFIVALDQSKDADLELSGLVKHGVENPHAENIAQLLRVYDYIFRLSSCYPMFIRRDAVSGDLIKLRELEL